MEYLLIILVTLILSAFFSGMEIAFIGINKLRVELKNKQGNLSANLLSRFIKTPTRFISTTLIGNNIALVIYGIYMGLALEPFLRGSFSGFFQNEFIVLFVSTIISTLFVLIFAEFMPKTLFRINSDVIVSILILPFYLFYLALLPFVVFIDWLSKRLLTSIFKVEFSENAQVFSKVDLNQYVSESASAEEDEEQDVNTEIFKNALGFANVKVRECMIPRPEIEAVELSESIDLLYDKFIKTGHSKVIIYENSIDNIIGYVHLMDMFNKPKSIRSIFVPIIIATETMQAHDLLLQFTQQQKSIALVVDEFGGTAGIVTIEDIIEEIFGEIEDEYDNEQLKEKQLSDTEFLFSARLEIDHLNNKYDLNIPTGDYETLGGFIVSEHESIPQKQEQIVIEPFEFTITSVTNTRIDEVRLKILGDN